MRLPTSPYDDRRLTYDLNKLSQSIENLTIRLRYDAGRAGMLTEIPTMQAALLEVERDIARITTDPNQLPDPWSITSAAKALNISRQTFYSRYFV